MLLRAFGNNKTNSRRKAVKPGFFWPFLLLFPNALRAFGNNKTNSRRKAVKPGFFWPFLLLFPNALRIRGDFKRSQYRCRFTVRRVEDLSAATVAAGRPLLLCRPAEPEAHHRPRFRLAALAA